MPTVAAHRRALHRIPELDDRLPETCAYVCSILESLGRRPPPSGRIWTPCR